MRARVSVVALVAALVVGVPACKQRDSVADRFVTTVPAPRALRGIDRLKFELTETEQMLSKRPRSWFTLRRAAELHLAVARFTGERAKHCKRALELARRALAQKSPIPAHRWLEVRALSCLGQHARAKARFDALPAAYKAGPHGARLAVHIALAAGRLADARAQLAKVGRGPGAQFLRAQVLEREGKLAAAEARLASIRSPRWVMRVARARARVSYALGKYKVALAFAWRALKGEPGHVPTLLLYARASKAIGRLDPARFALAVARKVNPHLAVPPDLANLGPLQAAKAAKSITPAKAAKPTTPAKAAKAATP